MMLPGPIEQNIFGMAGAYQCLNIEKKTMNYRDFRRKSMQFESPINKTPEQIEQMFWKSVAFCPTLYGADIQTSLMESCAGSWNLSSLKSVLSQALDFDIKGVNVPYIYVGSWKALFCWHKQDMDLSAINYLHEGRSKFWYSIPRSQGPILQKAAQTLFPQQFGKCSEHLRHKTTLINPYMLKNKNAELNITKAEHKPGQFILVFGGAYHTGFNFGFNLAEAVNYAPLSWLSLVGKAKSCACRNDSVKISCTDIVKNLAKSNFKKTKQFFAFKKQNIGKQNLVEQSDEEPIQTKGVYHKSIAKRDQSEKQKSFSKTHKNKERPHSIQCRPNLRKSKV